VPSPERDIKAVLDESGPNYDSFSFERPTASHQGEVFLVTLNYAGDAYEIVIKFKANDPEFGLEPFLHDYVADRTDIPVPGILVFKERPELDVDPYFVTEKVEGSNLAQSLTKIEPVTRERIIKQAGAILGDMHSEIGFEGFGRLGLDDDRIIVRDFSWDWQQFFKDTAEGVIDRLDNTPFEGMQERARENLENSIGIIDSDGVPRLVHDDFRPANMLFLKDREKPITSVLDWQFTLAGDPEYHIARTEFLFIDPTFEDAKTRERLRSSLYEGYRQYREFDPDEGYEQRRLVYHFATLIWRMVSFNASFEEHSGLARARAEARFRRQFNHLSDILDDI